MISYERDLRLGIVQTTLNYKTAWMHFGKNESAMNPYAASAVMDEIRQAFRQFYDLGENAPKIVILPEYSIPHSGMKTLEKFARKIDAVVIGGRDMVVNGSSVRNQAVIIVPGKWPETERAYSSINAYFGKKYFSEYELERFDELKLQGIPDMITYLISAERYGNIGVAICADFYDIERFVIYKGKIHHLIIIAYNKDYKSFEFLAEAISRMLLCNVVICNSGYYGDSLVYSPYQEEYKRILYKAGGAKLFTSQIISLPVRALDESQTAADSKYQRGSSISSEGDLFKWPPGYSKQK